MSHKFLKYEFSWPGLYSFYRRRYNGDRPVQTPWGTVPPSYYKYPFLTTPRNESEVFTFGKSIKDDAALNNIFQASRIRNKLIFVEKGSGRFASPDLVAQSLKTVSASIQPEFFFRKYEGDYSLRSCSVFNEDRVSNSLNGAVIESMGKANRCNISQWFDHDLHIFTEFFLGPTCKIPVSLVNYYIRNLAPKYLIDTNPRYSEYKFHAVLPYAIWEVCELIRELERNVSIFYAEPLFGRPSGTVRLTMYWNVIRCMYYTVQRWSEEAGRDMGASYISSYNFWNGYTDLKQPRSYVTDPISYIYAIPILYVRLKHRMEALKKLITIYPVTPEWLRDFAIFEEMAGSCIEVARQISERLFLGSEVQDYFSDGDDYTLLFSPNADRNMSEYLSKKLYGAIPSNFDVLYTLWRRSQLREYNATRASVTYSLDGVPAFDFTKEPKDDTMLWAAIPFNNTSGYGLEFDATDREWYYQCLSQGSNLYYLLIAQLGATVLNTLASWPLLKLAKIFSYMYSWSHRQETSTKDYIVCLAPNASKYEYIDKVFGKISRTPENPWSRNNCSVPIPLLDIGMGPDFNVEVKKIPREQQELNSLN